MNRFDIVIIGSGIGGLVCGAILGMEGYKVCVLEKNRQIGGALQSFSRDKVILDSGVHYLGGLHKGQNLYQIFQYIGILDQLRLTPMDTIFDTILIEGDEKTYAYAQGYEAFVSRLAEDFPGERDAIQAYADKIREVCSRFPLYNLRTGGAYEEKAGVLEIDAKTYIESITENKKLREVLAGNNILYAGQPYKTPFYVHALILNSYIESSWKCIDGGARIAQVLAKKIRALGGVVKTRAAVKKIVEAEGRVSHVELENGESFYADAYISNLHPVRTLEMTDTPLIKKAYRHRHQGLENSISSFSLHVVLKEKSFRYIPRNVYYHREGCAWTMADYTPDNWPLGYALFFSPSRTFPEFAASLTIMTYMKYEELREWSSTFNTTDSPADRGLSYKAFKEAKATRLLDLVEQRFSGIRDAMQTWYASTPLSFRDYLGTDDGSMYGIVKDYKDPVKTLVPARTKLPNLYLTGQNLNLHGILGSAISALVTCSELLGNEHFIEKIRHA